MSALLPRSGYCGFAILLLPMAILAGELPSKDFVPNFVAVEDVTLSSPDGNSRGKLSKGTAVAATSPGTAVLDVRTKDGRFGLVPSRSFSRLGRSIRITDDAKQAAESNNAFAFDLFQQLRHEDGNLFFSPGSISTALVMTSAGATGDTQREMFKTLHLGPDQKTHEGHSTLVALLNSAGDRSGYFLSTANRLWAASSYQFEESFLDLTRKHYLAELKTLTFGESEASRNIINGWVRDQTRGKIGELIPQGTITAATRLVLTNAIYFQGGWASEFSRTGTGKAIFHLSTGKTCEVQMMQQTDNFAYAEDAESQILSLPYRGNELSMVVVLPKEATGLNQLERMLTIERFTDWRDRLRDRSLVEIHLPRFKLRSSFTLSKVLQIMGMASAFSGKADFSLMSKSESLMISEVIHQAFVEVDEKGTEAAAATAILMSPSAAPGKRPDPPKPIVFRADHPFLFMIQDNRTGAVLFIGRTAEPKP